MSIELVMPSNHLIVCRPLLLLPSIFPSIRVFSNESTLHIRWPKYWSFSFSIIPSREHPEQISFRIDCLNSLQSKGLSRVFSNTTVQKHQSLYHPPNIYLGWKARLHNQRYRNYHYPEKHHCWSFHTYSVRVYERVSDCTFFNSLRYLAFPQHILVLTFYYRQSVYKADRLV